MDKPTLEYQTQNLPALKQIDFSYGIAGIPPMPQALLNVLTFIRLLPSLVQGLLSLVLWTNALPATGLTAWIYAKYGLTPGLYGLFALAFAIGSVVWSYKAPFRRFLALRLVGIIIWTFPLFFYIVCADWYVLFVAQPVSRTTVLFYSALYILMLAMYTANALMAIWFEEIRQSQLHTEMKKRTEAQQ